MIAPPKPPRDELEALIEEARERQRRRRLLGAAAVAIAAGLSLGIYALAGGFGQRQVAGVSGAGGPPPCRSSQLSASAFLQPATPGGAGPITIVNTGGSACSFPRGFPIVRMSWAGKPQAVREEKIHGQRGPPAEVLAPGAKAAVPLTWSNWCGGAIGQMVRVRFDVRFRSGLTVVALTKLDGGPACLNSARRVQLGVGRPFQP